MPFLAATSQEKVREIATLLADLQTAVGDAGAILAEFSDAGAATALVAVLLVLAGIRTIVASLGLEFDQVTMAQYAGLVSPFTLVDGTLTLIGAESSVGPAAAPDGAGALLHALQHDGPRAPADARVGGAGGGARGTPRADLPGRGPASARRGSR